MDALSRLVKDTLLSLAIKVYALKSGLKNGFYLWKPKAIFAITFFVRYFQTRFLKAAEDFIASLESKMAAKVFYNIDLAEHNNDPKLFKKLQGEIWEFRTKYLGLQIRLLAFWDKTDKEQTLVFTSHGFVKKVSKVSSNEIDKAEAIRKQYFEVKAAAEKSKREQSKKQ